MKILAISSLMLALVAGQAWGFGILVEGEGYLALDPDNLHTASIFDYDRDGRPDLVQETGNTFRVSGLDGSTTWSATIDTLALCPECTGPGGFWNFTFVGFFFLEEGQYDAVIHYYYFANGLDRRGTLVVAVADGAVRYQLADRYLVAGFDFDNDGYQDLACSRNNSPAPDSWEVWGRNGVSGVAPAAGPRLHVAQNRPNPFNPQTTVAFELPEAGPARVEIHDAAGRLVVSRPLGDLPAGGHEFTWNGVDRRGRRVASGTYILTVVAGAQSQARKMVLIK